MFTEENRHVSLLHAINKILLKDWDPLRIYRNPALQDEYEEYLPSLFRFICEQASETEIFEYLWWVENKVMEVKGNKTHTLKIASVHDKFHRTLILSGFCFLKIAKISLNSSFFPKPIKR